MSADTFFDIVRLLNAVISSLIFCALCYKGTMYFKKYDGQQKLLYASFTMYTFAAAYGSVEAYNQNLQGGARLFLLFAANIPAVIAFVRYRRSAFTPQ